MGGGHARRRAGLGHVPPRRPTGSHPLPVEKVVNPIGSGDALAAGIAWAIRAGRDMVEAVQLGIAAAAENLRQLETCRLDRERVQNLPKTCSSKKLEFMFWSSRLNTSLICCYHKKIFPPSP